MAYRRYNLLLLGGIAVVALFLCGATLRYDPVVGDLTRLGAYADNDFGWNGEQEIFRPALASVGVLGEHYDIVVLGDSFSMRTTPDRQTPYGGFWTDFLAARTGLSVGVFDMNKTSLSRLLAAPAYASAPPTLVVFEVVERAMDLPFIRAPEDCHADASRLRPIELRPNGILPQRVRRDISRSLTEARFSQMVAHLKVSAGRWLGRPDTTSVLRVPMARSDLFSHRDSGEILIYADDLRKKYWTPAHVARIRCGLHRYQELAQSNGITQFVALIAPDKSTVYAEYLPPAFTMPNVCEMLSADAALNLVCVDALLRKAVALGAKDVYLPNDTHWASVGAKIAARAVVDYFARR
jgi:hypothetical protein